MGTGAPTPVVIPVRCAPANAPCPTCGTPGRRKRTLTRTVRTIAYRAVAVLEVTYGEYAARCGCCTTFRDAPRRRAPQGPVRRPRPRAGARPPAEGRDERRADPG